MSYLQTKTPSSNVVINVLKFRFRSGLNPLVVQLEEKRSELRRFDVQIQERRSELQRWVLSIQSSIISSEIIQ